MPESPGGRDQTARGKPPGNKPARGQEEGDGAASGPSPPSLPC